MFSLLCKYSCIEEPGETSRPCELWRHSHGSFLLPVFPQTEIHSSRIHFYSSYFGKSRLLLLQCLGCVVVFFGPVKHLGGIYTVKTEPGIPPDADFIQVKVQIVQCYLLIISSQFEKLPQISCRLWLTKQSRLLWVRWDCELTWIEWCVSVCAAHHVQVAVQHCSCGPWARLLHGGQFSPGLQLWVISGKGEITQWTHLLFPTQDNNHFLNSRPVVGRFITFIGTDHWNCSLQRIQDSHYIYDAHTWNMYIDKHCMSSLMTPVQHFLKGKVPT